MKIRNGFVTNSSSSSYVCSVCGEIETGYDLCLSDIDMIECVNGDIICEHHLPSYDEKDWKLACLKDLENAIEKIEENVKDYRENSEDRKEGRYYPVTSDEQAENNLKKADRYREEYGIIENMEEVTDEYVSKLEEKNPSRYSLLTADTDFERLYKDYFNDEYRYYFPECLCPVCTNEIVLDDSALLFAIQKLGITRKELDDMYREANK